MQWFTYKPHPPTDKSGVLRIQLPTLNKAKALATSEPCLADTTMFKGDCRHSSGCLWLWSWSSTSSAQRTHSSGTCGESSLKQVAWNSKRLIATEQLYAQIENALPSVKHCKNFTSISMEAKIKYDGSVMVTTKSFNHFFQSNLASALKRLKKITFFLRCYSSTLAYRKDCWLQSGGALSRSPCQNEHTSWSLDSNLSLQIQ